MKKIFFLLIGLLSNLAVSSQTIIETDSYRWVGDTIFQGEYFSYAPNDSTIISNYSAQPGYFMPIEKAWKLKNDISGYPSLKSDNVLHNAIYNMGLDEMINNVESDTTLRTGKEWGGVWTRDVSYSIILSMAQLQPEAAKISLRKKITPDGRIMQDTGSGGAWPVSTDRMIWIVAAWELYKATGNVEWIKEIFPVVRKSLADDMATVYSDNGLIKGETSFIDWREQSYPRWMQTADIFDSESLSTSVVHVQALRDASKMAALLGDQSLALEYEETADKVNASINQYLWIEDKGIYGMYIYGRQYPVMNPRAEALGESLAILFDVATPQRAETITENYPTTPFGAPVFFPQISDIPPYHNNALWPFVASYWALANAKAGNEEGILEAIGSVYRPAALFTTNKENLVIDNGDIATQLNSSNMLWSIAGNLAITYRILFGINLEQDGIRLQPAIPENLSGTRELLNYPYRDKVLNIKINGWGNKIAAIMLNGKTIEGNYISAGELKPVNSIEIVMADMPFDKMAINRTKNVKAPITPIVWIEDSILKWNPIEYIGHYNVIKDGRTITQTNSTEFLIKEPGEYMIIGVSNEGVESFASEPRSTRPKMIVEVPYETTDIKSKEIAYQPKTPITGYRGKGFTESDKTVNLTIPVFIQEGQGGEYVVSLRYANGNGPVNTENKCAIRTFLVDGKKEGVFVMPQRGVGNWSDWGETNLIRVNLTEGNHVLEIKYLPENENMNIDTNHFLFDDLTLIHIPTDN